MTIISCLTEYVIIDYGIFHDDEEVREYISACIYAIKVDGGRIFASQRSNHKQMDQQHQGDSYWYSARAAMMHTNVIPNTASK